MKEVDREGFSNMIGRRHWTTNWKEERNLYWWKPICTAQIGGRRGSWKKKRGPFITMNSEDVHSSFSPSSYFEGCNQGVWDYNGTITFYLEPLQQLFYEIKRKKLLHYQEISNYEASFESWKSSVTHQRKSYILGQENHRQ